MGDNIEEPMSCSSNRVPIAAPNLPDILPVAEATWVDVRDGIAVAIRIDIRPGGKPEWVFAHEPAEIGVIGGRRQGIGDWARLGIRAFTIAKARVQDAVS